MAYILGPPESLWSLITGSNRANVILTEIGIPGVTITGVFPENYHVGMRLASGNILIPIWKRIMFVEDFANLPIFADNATAFAGGIKVGLPYRTSVGVVMVCY